MAIDTHKWHTVSTVKYSDMNKAIAAEGKTPPGFDKVADDDSARITGTFGPWRLTTGSAGTLIHMALPITSGQVTVGSTSHPIENNPIVTIELNANYVKRPNSGVHDLVTDPTSPVSVLSIEPKQPVLVADAMLKDLMPIWMSENVDKFYALFTSVDFDVDYSKAGVPWLAPSFTGYAVAEPKPNPTVDTSVFGVMSMIDGETTPAQDWQVSLDAIPDGADASFCVSMDKFLQHMMLAAIPVLFEGMAGPASDHFVIDNDGTRISNKQAATFTPVKLDNGNVVNPTVAPGMFGIQLLTTYLNIDVVDMKFEYSPGITVFLTYHGEAEFYLDTEHTIIGLRVLKETSHGSVEVSEAIKITEIVLACAAVLLTVVGGFGGYVGKTADAAVQSATRAALGAAEAGAEEAAAARQITATVCTRVISRTPVGMAELAARCMVFAKVASIAVFCTSLMPAITEIIKNIADNDYTKLPKITDLTSAAIGTTVIWPKAVGDFELKTAQLDGAFVFGLKRKQ